MKKKSMKRKIQSMNESMGSQKLRTAEMRKIKGGNEPDYYAGMLDEVVVTPAS